jgi:hypothetical protein
MIVDYLTYTFGEDHEVNLLGLVKRIDPGAVPLETKSGYAHDWILWGNGRLQWGHRGDVVARLSLPGSALALYREAGGDIGSLIIMIGEAGGRCTRVDFAFDWDVEASPVIDRIISSIRDSEYTSRWRLENNRSSLINKPVLGSGYTLYLGSAQSDCRLRVYDKAAEQEKDIPWLRVEFQMRKERADAAICFLTRGTDEAVEYVKALVLAYFDIKEPLERDSNKWRWPTADWWVEMWGKQKERITLGSGMPTEDQSRAWLERMGPTFAIHTKLNGGDVSWMDEIIAEGGKPVEQGGRWRPVHEAKLKAWFGARAKEG